MIATELNHCSAWKTYLMSPRSPWKLVELPKEINSVKDTKKRPQISLYFLNGVNWQPKMHERLNRAESFEFTSWNPIPKAGYCFMIEM